MIKRGRVHKGVGHRNKSRMNPIVKGLIIAALFFIIVFIIYTNVFMFYGYFRPVMLSPGEDDAGKVTSGFFIFLGVMALSVVVVAFIYRYLVRMFEEDI